VSADLHQRFVNGNSWGRICAFEAVLSGFFGMHGLTPSGAVTPRTCDQASDALARMEVARLAGRFLDEMSTGEVRRVLVARALVTTPVALILDEPATGLDLVARHRLVTLMNRVAESGHAFSPESSHTDGAYRWGASAITSPPGVAMMYASPVRLSRATAWNSVGYDVNASWIEHDQFASPATVMPLMTECAGCRIPTSLGQESSPPNPWPSTTKLPKKLRKSTDLPSPP